MLTLTEEVAQGLVAHARECAPIEACGYLSGNASLVTQRLPLTNVDASAEHFSLDPAEQFAAVRLIRSQGQSLIAVYHSHPATPARPSEEDIRLAVDPALWYVIVSLVQPEGSIRSYRIRNGVVTEEPVVIEKGGVS
jgi:proteasome lid subunit RPN8/RPN11